MRLHYLFFLYILNVAIFGCSHKYGIKKSYAYTRTMTAGNIPVDDQNRPQIKGVQRTYLIYLEMEDTISKPQWDTAWVDSTAFSIAALKIAQENITIGKTAFDQQDVTLKAQPGNTLWQLLLTPLPHSLQLAETQNKLESNKVVLVGTWKGKNVSYTIKEIVELERIFMQ